MTTISERPKRQQTALPFKAGLSVKTDLRAGDWACRDCTGNAQGSSIFKPACDYCQQI